MSFGDSLSLPQSGHFSCIFLIIIPSLRFHATQPFHVLTALSILATEKLKDDDTMPLKQPTQWPLLLPLDIPPPTRDPKKSTPITIPCHFMLSRIL